MPLFDLHAHFSFKPANSSNAGGDLPPDPDHWPERFKDKWNFSAFAQQFDGDVVKSSQLHGNAATAGGFRTIVNGLYPLELGFTTALANRLLATLVGHDVSVLRDIHARKISPFQLLEREYFNLLQGQARNANSAIGNRYKVVDSFAEMERLHAADPNTICIVNSIEGGHAFADILHDRSGNTVNIHREEARFLRQVSPRKGDSWFELYIEGMLMNIDRVKTTWEHTPLFVTLAHHYYNHLCGHAPSLTHIVALTAGQHGGAPNATGYDTSYFHLGIRRWGHKVMQHLLARKNMRGEAVRRILIDTKHMAPRARQEYYAVVDQHRINFEDHIPIIASHTAVNGRRSLQDTLARSEEPGASTEFKLMPGEQESTKHFYDGVIGLFDDEIVRIVDSDGIIGLMIDERRILGKQLPPEAGIPMKEFNALSKLNKGSLRAWTQAKHQHAWGEMSAAELQQELAAIAAEAKPRMDRLRPAYLCVLLRQLFHVVQLTGAHGWDHVALGTDYDGVINPIDIYPQSSDMARLEHDLTAFWKTCTTHPDPAIAALYTQHLHGRTPAQRVQQVLWENGMAFLRKYFNDEYLLKGRMVG